MTREDLKQIIYDPYKLMDGMIADVEETTQELVDPNNPFILNKEMAAMITTGALTEMMGTYRNIYPSLATGLDELHGHMTDDLAVNMFSSPSTIKMQLNINYNNLFSYGIKPTGRTNVSKATIPAKTRVIIGDIVFTLMNKISVVLDNGNSFVEEEHSGTLSDDRSIEFTNKGILPSYITTDAEGNKWISFITTLSQLDIKTYTTNILEDEVFSHTIKIDEQYFNLEATLEIDGNIVPMNRTHSDEIIDPSVPTMLVNVGEKEVTVTIPNINHYNTQIGGVITMDVYTTKGKVLIPLSSKQPDEFTISFPSDNKDEYSAVFANINIVANTDDVLDGGVDMRVFKDVKNKIINQTSGNFLLPVTNKQLVEVARVTGFRVNKVEDTITSRLYMANKNIIENELDTKTDININVYGGTLEFVAGDYTDSDDISIHSDIVMIKSSGMFSFKEGKLRLLTKQEKANVINMNNIDRMNYLNDNDTYVSPYYYVVDVGNDVLNHRIFDLDNPTIPYRNIESKNTSAAVICNVNNYRLTKTNQGYLLELTVIGNEAMASVENDMKVMVSILDVNNAPMYLSTTYDEATKIHSCLIETMNVVSVDDTVSVLNTISTTGSTDINLDIIASVYLYIDIPEVNTDSYIHNTDLNYVGDIQVFTKESLNITLGKNLTYLWSKVKGGYTSRKFLKHTSDKLARYPEDIFELDANGCPVIIVGSNPTPTCEDYQPHVIHGKGDVILDANGVETYEYKIGDDVIVDGFPVVDTIGGTVRYLDILLLDYKVTSSTNILYINQLDLIKLRISRWLENDLVDLNNMLIENTIIKYRPSVLLEPVITSEHEYIKSKVSPNVVLFITRDKLASFDNLIKLKSAIGKILHKYLGKQKVILDDIRKEIMSTYSGSIEGVKIEGITFDDREVITTIPSSSKLYLETKLDLANKLYYNIKISIKTID